MICSYVELGVNSTLNPGAWYSTQLLTKWAEEHGVGLRYLRPGQNTIGDKVAVMLLRR